MYDVYFVDGDRRAIIETCQAVDWAGHGFAIVGFNTDPALAVEEIIKLKPHLVVFEYHLPKMNGIKFMDAVRRAGAKPEFVMLTKDGIFSLAREFFENGGADYLLKPIEQQDAQKSLKRIAGRLNANE